MTKYGVRTGTELLTFDTEYGARIAARLMGASYVGPVEVKIVITMEKPFYEEPDYPTRSRAMLRRLRHSNRNGLRADGKPDMRLAKNRHLKNLQEFPQENRQ